LVSTQPPSGATTVNSSAIRRLFLRMLMGLFPMGGSDARAAPVAGPH
jgi:hypothetical protein